MSTPSVANVKTPENGHWYTVDGKPCYEVPKKDGKGMTATTLRHARTMNLIPSVTTILRILDKPALTAWKIEQAVQAVMTSPRIAGEEDDAFIDRVLRQDREQDQERDAAAQLGTDIHAAIEAHLHGQPVEPRLHSYIAPVLELLPTFGTLHASEAVVVGNGYAGRTDAWFVSDSVLTVVDFKSTKRLPKESYNEARLQLAAYANTREALLIDQRKQRRGVNVYISTTEPGQIAVCDTPELMTDTYLAFKNLVNIWQWMNGYAPIQ